MSTKNLIIGAGPAGLAIAGRMRQLDMPFRLLEKSNNIADSWHHHYDRLHLHTIKSLSHLPGLKFPKEYPRYVPRAKLIDYYNSYVAQFNINAELNTEAESVERGDDKWEIKTNKGLVKAENVIFCTGINRKPFEPEWPGKETFQGKIIHSRKYKNPSEFKGQKVLVIGMGNTGAEIAYDLSENDVDTFLSVRSPVNIVPRDINGNPTQVTGKLLSKVPYGDWIGKKVAGLVIGDLSQYGLMMSKDYPAKQMRDTGKTPVIDIGTVKNIKNEKIKIRTDVQSFSDSSITFTDESTEGFDAVILATGYRAAIDDFLADTDGLLDKHHYPKSPIGEGTYDGLYFIGFDNYKLGGILGTINTDSKTVLDHITNRN